MAGLLIKELVVRGDVQRCLICVPGSLHRRTKVRKPQINGFIERFHRTALDEFFRIVFRTTFYQAVEPLQADFDRWLVEYDTERPHQGYRNMGRRPIETILQYLESVRQGG